MAETAVLDKIASLVNELPAMPVVAQRALQMISDPSTEPEELQAVLSKDSALTLKILRLANSAYYRRNRRVTTLNTAILMLGFKTIQTLILSSAVQRVLSSAGALAKALWIHSFGTALACRELARRSSNSSFGQEEIFLSGLFHDVAKGIIATKFPGVYLGAVGAREELDVLGFHHGQLGRVLLEKWEIPFELAEAVGTHHDPSPREMGRITSMADWLIWPLAPGVGVAPARPPEGVFESFCLDASQLEEARGSVEAYLAEERSAS